MKKNILKLLALMLTLIMVFSLASCKKEEDPTETEEETEITEETESVEETEDAEEETEGEEDTTVENAVTGAPFELNSSDVSEVLALYKKAFTPAVNNGMNGGQQLTLAEKITGKGAIASIIGMAQPIVDSVLKQNETDFNHLPGDMGKFSADDILTASARSDDQYTYISFTIKEQVDGVDGKSNEGPVGHSIGVLDGIDGVLNDLSEKGLKADLSNGGVTLTYKNATVDVKLDKETGKIVEGQWKHYTHINATNVKIKVSFINVSVEELNAVILFDIKTK